MISKQIFGRNITGYIEEDFDKGPTLVLKIPLTWDGKNITKKGYTSIASTEGRRRIHYINDEGVLVPRTEKFTLAVWGDKPPKGECNGF